MTTDLPAWAGCLVHQQAVSDAPKPPFSYTLMNHTSSASQDCNSWPCRVAHLAPTRACRGGKEHLQEKGQRAEPGLAHNVTHGYRGEQGQTIQTEAEEEQEESGRRHPTGCEQEATERKVGSPWHEVLPQGFQKGVNPSWNL